MRRLPVILVLVAMLPVESAWSFITEYGDKIDDPEIKACFTKSLPDETIKQVVTFNTIAGEQSTGSSNADIYWRKFDENDSRVYVKVNNPPARAGVGLLILENEEGPPGMHMYLPELRSVRRITGRTLSGSMLGTDFSYEDFMQVYGVAPTTQVKRTADQIVEDRSVYAIDLEPADESSSYSRLQMLLDKEWCVPLRIKFYSDKEELEKTLIVESVDIKTINDRHIPLRFMMHDHANESRTEVIIEKIEVDKNIRASIFTVGNLGSGR